MGICKDCAYAKLDTDKVFPKYYCTFYQNPNGSYNYVQSTATCNNFKARASMSSGGYTGSSGSSGCFITSACVEYFGKSDDCEELTTLRAFRDGYMKSTEKGEELVKEYYSIAPKIVEKINSSTEKEKYYSKIQKVVDECVGLIKDDMLETALEEYKRLVLDFKKEFNL